MHVDVVMLPVDLKPSHLTGRAVVVFDVLRATTSMCAALAAEVSEIRIFGDTRSAASACATFSGSCLLCGEEKALPPPGFDLGNSPPSFKAELHHGRTLFMSTTNGTRAILACQRAAAIFIGALVNASAVAGAVAELGMDVTLVCAGTDGKIAMEDLIGCGAVLEVLDARSTAINGSDATLIARQLFRACRHDLASALRLSKGGQNVMAVGLSADIDFAARLDSLDVVGRVVGDPPVVRRVMTA